MDYFDWDRFDAEQGDEAEAAVRRSRAAPAAASRVGGDE